jgi:hypothetical protein
MKISRQQVWSIVFAIVVICLNAKELAAQQKQAILESTSSVDSIDCITLQYRFTELAVGAGYQTMYDSGKYVIEHCASYNPSVSVWGDFGAITTGCQSLAQSNLTQWTSYRNWLKKVLYYSLDSLYYCSDADAIMSTFHYFEGRGFDVNGALAVLKYLHDSSKCAEFSWYKDFDKIWKSSRDNQYQNWVDTGVIGKFPPYSPLDTTLPSLEDLDLQILRGPQYAAVKNAFTPSTTNKILYLKASENPFTKETTLYFGLSDKEYVKLELFDLLGKIVYANEALYMEGDGSLQISGNNIPLGQLYARFSTMGREVMTIKLIKE